MKEPSELISFRDFKAKDAWGICELLGKNFKQEYEEQGLNIYKYANFFKLLGHVNILLRIIHLEFFKIYVAVYRGQVIGCTIGYRIAKRTWYHGFSTMAPEYRGKHIFTTLVCSFFESLLKTSAVAAYGEVAPENKNAAHIWTQSFGGHVTATKNIFIFNSEQPSQIYNSKCRFEKVGSHEKINGQYAVSDIVPVLTECINQGFFQCLFHWILPPTIYKSFVCKITNKFRLFIRCRIQYPGNHWSVDTLWYDSQMNQEELEQLIKELLAFFRSHTQKPVKIYTDKEDQRLSQLLEKQGLTSFGNMSFVVYYRDELENNLDRLRNNNI